MHVPAGQGHAFFWVYSSYVANLIMLCVFTSLISFNLSYSEEVLEIPFNSSNSLYFLLPGLYNFLGQKNIG